MGFRDIINKIKRVFIKDKVEKLPAHDSNYSYNNIDNKSIENDAFTDGLKGLTQDVTKINTREEYSQRDYAMMYFWKNCGDINYDKQSIKDKIHSQYENVELSDVDIQTLLDMKRYKFSDIGKRELSNGSPKKEYMDDIDNVLAVADSIVQNAQNEARAYGYDVDRNPNAILPYINGSTDKNIDAKYKESLEVDTPDISI